MCTSANDIRLGEIFNQNHMGTMSRSCTSGGCAPEVVVEFRPNKSAYGTFGFDWLRVEDAELDNSKSDVKYTKNIGDHYKKKSIKDGKEIFEDLCTKDADITSGSAFFKANSLNTYPSVFYHLTPLNSQKIPALHSTFKYRVPVITLMPNDLACNVDNVNLEAIIDINVYVGEIKPKSLKIECVKVGANGEPTKVAFDISNKLTINLTNVPLTKKSKLIIKSVGTLEEDVMLIVKANDLFVCGAVKILRNNAVRDVEVIYVGTTTNFKNKAKPEKFSPPSVDLNSLRSRLGQALINIKKVHLLDKNNKPMYVDCTNRITKASVKYKGVTYKGMNYETISLNDLDTSFQDRYKEDFSKQPIRETKNNKKEIWSFDENLFRCYFFKNSAVTPYYGVPAAGAGAMGDAHSMFFDGKGSVGTLSHELGHNLDVAHTFDPENNAYCFERASTDNIMDYSSDKIIFYYEQWKKMNPKGIK